MSYMEIINQSYSSRVSLLACSCVYEILAVYEPENEIIMNLFETVVKDQKDSHQESHFCKRRYDYEQRISSKRIKYDLSGMNEQYERSISDSYQEPACSKSRRCESKFIQIDTDSDTENLDDDGVDNGGREPAPALLEQRPHVVGRHRVGDGKRAVPHLHQQVLLRRLGLRAKLRQERVDGVQTEHGKRSGKTAHTAKKRFRGLERIGRKGKKTYSGQETATNPHQQNNNTTHLR